jgi:hypothetical protein
MNVRAVLRRQFFADFSVYPASRALTCEDMVRKPIAKRKIKCTVG